ncbi:hypothetical protein KDI_20410 [Dictyobacter arantiisoli]|uniref:Uncharacterized protein n=2 Tax=Dictyobacter arantiisoli TaxID=2014874 RepID=A0A5A5TAU5_9CHLR|nr:hypothetical protein KDI_20410 [Dictyobacter arantiisoli]
MWVPWIGTGIEHLRLQQIDKGIYIDSVVVGSKHKQPFRVWYKIYCDSEWRVQTCLLHRYGPRSRELKFQVDSQGHWVDADNISLSALEGCIDVDISATPFTNTLPIRRLSLLPGQSTDILVTYISIPELEIVPVKKRYTCLETSDNGSLYHYENLTRGFATELHVDAQGLVLDYPEVWKRSWNEFF